LPDLSGREWALVAPTVALAILMGVLPGIFLRPMEPSVALVIERVTGGQPSRVRVDQRTPPAILGEPAVASLTTSAAPGAGNGSSRHD
jgi:hypothetical protein